MAQLLEYIKMAFKNIRSNKGRSFLTMLGIIIGIGSVIMIMSLGEGVKGMMNEELGSIAGGMVQIYQNSDAETMEWITEDDMKALENQVEHVTGVTPQDYMWGTAYTEKGEIEGYINFVSDAYQYMIEQPIVAGRYITKADIEAGSLVTVISEDDARKMFGSTNVVGLNIEVTLYNVTKDVKIIGVQESLENGTFVTYSFGDNTIDIYLPYTAMRQFGYSTEEFYSVSIIAEGPEYASEVAQNSINLLESRKEVYGEENLFLAQDIASEIDAIASIMDMVTLFITFVAAISLLVGGIGVMNIMLVSVTERTREIGIRKALGARTNYILLQFLSEAAIITLTGGVIGILFGIGGGKLVGLVSGGMIDPRLTLGTVLFATVFSSFVGLFFGIYPARRAARLSPIEALRRN